MGSSSEKSFEPATVEPKVFACPGRCRLQVWACAMMRGYNWAATDILGDDMPAFRIAAFLASAALALLLTASAGAAAPANEDLEQRSGVEHMGALPQEKISGPILRAIGAPGRPQADRQLDPGRKPEQILAFYDIRPGLKVADLSAGAGWLTELLSRIVGLTGKVYSQNGRFPPRLEHITAAWKERLKNPELGNVVPVEKEFDAEHFLPVRPYSLDAVLIHLNYHDLVGKGVNRQRMNREIFDALRPGGIYGIVDHSAAAGAGAKEVSTLHRIGENFVIREVESAGFRLVTASSALRHPEDDRSWVVFKHRGATDRFMLKFVRPIHQRERAPGAALPNRREP
jgi:predicted methyltransferase